MSCDRQCSLSPLSLSRAAWQINYIGKVPKAHMKPILVMAEASVCSVRNTRGSVAKRLPQRHFGVEISNRLYSCLQGSCAYKWVHLAAVACVNCQRSHSRGVNKTVLGHVLLWLWLCWFISATTRVSNYCMADVIWTCKHMHVASLLFLLARWSSPPPQSPLSCTDTLSLL